MQHNSLNSHWVVAIFSVTGSSGCCGGNPSSVFDEVKTFISEKDYPYQGRNGSSDCKSYSCRSSEKPTISWQINGYDAFTPMSASDLKKQIWMYGPISAFMKAPDSWYNYREGIIDCTGLTPNIATYVVAVGFGSDFITLRNTYGSNWGLQGDFMLSTSTEEASCELLGHEINVIHLVRVSVVPFQCSSGDCCNTSAELFSPNGTVCRPKNGDCDIEEYCTGSSAECPDDTFLDAGTVCSDADDLCENDAICSGNSSDCPPKSFKSSNTICRAKNGDCDVAEYCTGSSVECPDDKNASSTTTCYAINGPCKSLTYCSGNSKSCVADNDSLVMWDDLSNGCIEYYCDNESGLQAIMKCKNSTVCMDGECVSVAKEVDEKKEIFTIVIEMKATDVITVTSNEIAMELSKMSSINADNITVAIEYDKEGKMKNILVYVSEESQAKLLSDAVNGIEKDDNCEGILCRSERAQVRKETQKLSLEKARKNHVEVILLLLLALISLAFEEFGSL